MTSRTRPKRAALESPAPSATPRARRLRDQVGAQYEVAYGSPSGIHAEDGEDEDAEGEDIQEDYELPIPATEVKRGRGRPKGSINKKKPRADDSDEDSDDQKARRLRKSVSYREIPVDVPMEYEDDEEDESTFAIPTTPRKRGRPPKRATDDDDDRKDASYGREKVGSGRGGFSVKGAAAAAARARWEKVRRERLERGEDVDAAKPRRSATAKKLAIRPPVDYELGSTVTIKGEQYEVGDDELVLPDDAKGDTKIDTEGHLLQGREYKLVTFTSNERRNSKRIYALTIDAARACGYSDSLAFLRRYPTILKLSCTADERVKLIDLGRISGNLKHRQVTMVAVRNVFKVMGAKMIKNGKHVVDDYYEDEAAARCAESGIAPGTVLQDEEFAVTINPNADRPSRTAGETRSLANLATFYTAGGPTTQFAIGNGQDPWTDSGLGNKRSKLRTAGVTEEDWMLRTAEECRAIDEQLRGYRGNALKVLEGVDGTRGWVWALENGSDGSPKSNGSADNRPPLDSVKSGLSYEVGAEAESSEHNSSSNEPNGDGDAEMDRSGVQGGEIIVEGPERNTSRYNWGLGKEWQPGVIRAVYEPHTNMPHIPLHTQPTTYNLSQLSPHPILSSSADLQHLNFVQSTITGRAARGLASVEYAFEGGQEDKIKIRLDEVKAAEEWEKKMKQLAGMAH